MKRVLIAFGSRTGNTADMANWIAERFNRKGFDVEIEDCTDLLVEGLCVPFDIVVLGTPSYDDQPDDVQKDFEQLLENLQHTGIRGKNVAIFGCGDRKYPRFCHAVDVTEKRVSECGGILVVSSLKVDAPYLAYRHEVEAWADRVANAA